MPRKATWPPPARMHASGRWRVRWRGEDHYLAAGDERGYAALVARLEREERRREADEERRKAAAARGPTVSEAVLRFSLERLPLLDPRQQRLYRRALACLCRVAGEVEAARFGAGHLDRVRQAMLDGSWLTREERGPKRRDGTGGCGPWSPRVASARCGLVRTAWRWLELREIVPEGRWAALRALPALPGRRPPRRSWSEADALAVARAVPARAASVRNLLLVQLWSGCRSGEGCAMRWDEIEQAEGVWWWRPAAHKNAWRGHARAIALGPKAQAVLRLQRRQEPRGQWVFPVRWRGRRPGPRTGTSYARTVQAAARRAGREGFTPYACRHLARMRFSRLGSLELARAALGHATAQTTAAYGEAQDARLAAEAARLAG